MKPVLLIILLLTIVAGSSCKKACKNPIAQISVNGFDSSELGIVIIRDYERSSPAFSHLLQTRVTGTFILATITNTDTVHYDYHSRALYCTDVNLDHDLEIAIPALGKAYRIRDFSIGTNHESGNIFTQRHDFCSNSLSYYLDDVAHTENPATVYESFEIPVALIAIDK